VRYGVAVLGVAIATLLGRVFDPLIDLQFPYGAFLAAVVVAGWFGGLGPSLAATGLGALASAYFFVPPVGSLGIPVPQALADQALYFAIAITLALLMEARRRAERRSDRNLRLARHRLEQLEAQRLRSDVTLASIGDAVITTDSEGRVNFLNAVAESLTGWKRDEARLRPLTDVFRIVNQETGASVENPVQRALRDGVIVGLANHTVLIRRDGSMVPIDDSASPIRADSGETLGAALIFRDVTTRRTAERALAESEQRFRTMADSAPVMIWTSEIDKHRSYFNRPWLTFTGRTQDQEYGDGWAGRVHAADREACLNVYSEAFDRREPFTMEYRLRRHDGEYRWVLENGVPRFGPDGQFAGYIGSCIDIADRKRAEDDLRKAKDEVSQILDSITEWFLAVDRDWRLIYVNRRLAQSIGKPVPEILGTNLWDLFPEAVQLDFYPNYHRVMTERIPLHFEVEYPPGSWLEVHAHPTEEGLSAYITDITGRKQVQETRARLAAIVESSSDAIVGKTLDGTIQTWNTGAERIYGYSAAEVISRPITILLPPGREHEEAEIVGRVASGLRVHDFDTVRLRKDGREIHVSITVSPIHNAAGEVVGASHIARDITERKLFDEHLRQSQRLESLGVLAGGVAHDFNNLLVGILGNASLASDSLPPEHPARPMMDEVVRASERAAGLTHQLLAYSGRGTFLVQTVELSAIVREIVSLVQSSIPRTVELRLDLAEGLPAIEADVTQIQQLVMNLVINGAEAIGERPGIVTVSTSTCEVTEADVPADSSLHAGTCVALEIRDTGCGMDQATKARIFDPFFTTKFTGRGLGLSSVLGIVRGHRGAIQVESTPGRGASFRVLFPAAAGEAVRAARTEAPRDYSGRGSVLVVDDEETVRRTAKLALERYGYEVLLAENGEQAIAVLRDRAHDVRLILLDLTMPLMSGDEALKHLRAIRPDVPIVLSSGFTEAEAVRRFRGQGLAGFLQKPYTAGRLAEKVKSTLAVPQGRPQAAG
jgi:PAS domain S-box-containing protein